jgi:hypothetical protein
MVLMRYDTILHPEMILNKRGPEFARSFLKSALDMIEVRKGGVYFEAHDPTSHFIAESLHRDKVFLRCLTTCKIFRDQKPPIYHIGRDFLQTLQKIDREIPVDILPEKFLAYFQFAENAIFDDDGVVEGGYICIDRGINLGMTESLQDKRVLSFTYLCQPKVEGMSAFASMTVELDAKKISELSSGIIVEDHLLGETRTPEQIEKRNNVFRALLNATIYLFSEDPVLEKTRPFREMGFSVKEMKRRGLIINETLVPITFINREYTRPRERHVDATWVESFPRWQRCGPNFSKVKLVFVTAHERRFTSRESESSA